LKVITSKKNLIKDYSKFIIYSVLISSIVLALLINIKYDINIILTFEQTIFVILSAILFVFNEAIIGYSTISKIRNSINNFKKKHIKNQVLLLIRMSFIEKYYDDFLNATEDDIIIFQENITEFKRKSFSLYSVFSIFGLFVVALSMLSKNSFLFSYFSFLQTNIHFLANIKYFLIDFFVISQLLAIPIWVVSAFQAEKQKYKMMKYFEIDNISFQIKEYVEQTRKKSISLSLNGQKR
jgi:hypothetical protein